MILVPSRRPWRMMCSLGPAVETQFSDGTSGPMLQIHYSSPLPTASLFLPLSSAMAMQAFPHQHAQHFFWAPEIQTSLKWVCSVPWVEESPCNGVKSHFPRKCSKSRLSVSHTVLVPASLLLSFSPSLHRAAKEIWNKQSPPLHL